MSRGAFPNPLDRLLSPDLAAKLERADRELLALGKAISNYVAFPSSLGLTERSSHREDSVVQQVSDLLRARTGTITVLDVCSGLAVVAKRIIESVGTDANRIHYWAIDRDQDCHDTVTASLDEFAPLGAFTAVLRDACDVEVCPLASVDLIVLNNALHEIPPRHFVKMFSHFVKMLRPTHGRLCIVDMEDLPSEAPESIAITWKPEDVVKFLEAGGLNPTATTHAKSVPVFRVVVEAIQADIDGPRMNAAIEKCLKKKLKAAIETFRKINKRRLDGAGLVGWVIAAGTIARLIDELSALASVNASTPLDGAVSGKLDSAGAVPSSFGAGTQMSDTSQSTSV